MEQVSSSNGHETTAEDSSLGVPIDPTVGNNGELVHVHAIQQVLSN